MRSPVKQQAILENIELASKVAWKFCAQRGLTKEFEEYKHDAMVALIIAVDQWDSTKQREGTREDTPISGPYLVQRIKWQLIHSRYKKSAIDKSHYEAIKCGREPPVVLVPLELKTAKRDSEKLEVRRLVDRKATEQFAQFVVQMEVQLSLSSLFRFARLSQRERIVFEDSFNETPRHETVKRIGREVNHVRQDAMARLKSVARKPLVGKAGLC